MLDKDQLVNVFDKHAIAYDQYRPGYPKEAITDLIALSGIKQGDKILEIGCGTGQISLAFLEKGFDLIAIERGKSLAQTASKKMQKFPNSHVIHSAFEDWEAIHHFPLALSAQAFHWIEKESGINKILNILEPNGSLGLIWNVDQSQDTPFWKATSSLYEKYLPTKDGYKSMEETIKEHETFLFSKKELSTVKRMEYDWKENYSKEAYLGLLSTYSSHMTMEKQKREAFFKEMASIIEGFDNQILRHYKTVLLFSTNRE